MKKTSIFLSVLGLGLLAACGSDDNTSSESAVITQAPGDEKDATAEDAGSDSGAPASVTKSGFSTFAAVDETYANMGALIQNNADEDFFLVEVTYNLIGSDGTKIATESSMIDFLPAGEAVSTTDWTMTDLTYAMPVTLEVTVLADEDSGYDNDWAEMEITVVDSTVVLDENGFGSFSGTITNPSDFPAEYYEVGCLVVAPDGSVLGGINGFGDTVEPGATVTWDAEGINDFEVFAEANGSLSNCRSFLLVS
jgi:hypothetical protein